MNEPTLYRIHIGPGWVSDPMDVVNDLIDEGVLVPAEPDGSLTTEDATYMLVKIGGDDGR